MANNKDFKVKNNLQVAEDIIFEGATEDGFETTLTATDPTADQTITMPDATGTVALTSGTTTTSIVENARKVFIDESSDDNYYRNIIFSGNTPSGSGNSYQELEVDDTGLGFNAGDNSLLIASNSNLGYLVFGSYGYNGSIGASYVKIAPNATLNGTHNITVPQATGTIVINGSTTGTQGELKLNVSSTGTMTGSAHNLLATDDVTFNSLTATDSVSATDVDISNIATFTPINHPTHAEGQVYYDTAHKTLSYQSDISDVQHEIGIEEHVRVFNNSGATIAKGKPVYWSGNANDHPTIGLANATSEAKYNMQGLTAGEIANNDYGYVIVSGLVDNIDTSSLSAGTNVFLGLSDGALQNASPTYPNFPMCLGWVIKSHATEGTILVNQQNHSVNSFRVRTSAHIGDDLIIGGDLTVLGSQTIASSENVSIANAWNYFNSGDTIGALNTNFSGSGLNDASFTGHFTGTTSTTYYVRIDGVGTGTNGVDTFEWSTDNFATTVATGVDITGDSQLIHSTDNIGVKFEATTGHTSGDTWTGTAAPVAVDTGFATNRNTGTSGVGYTHMGIFYDISTDKWTVFDEYDPEPEGTINTAHASFSYGTLKAGAFEGDVTGNLVGNVTGNVTGDITGNINLAPSNTITFEGATNDAFETVISVVDPTADRTIDFPDESGTVVLKATDGRVYIESTHQTPFNVTYANDSSIVGPIVRLFRDSASPATSDRLGAIDLKGNNSAGAEFFYSRIRGAIGDPTDGTEEGIIHFHVAQGGTAAWDDTTIEATLSSNGLELRSDLIFEGSTVNNAETIVTATDPTVDRTITLPDRTGTVLVVDTDNVIDGGSY